MKKEKIMIISSVAFLAPLVSSLTLPVLVEAATDNQNATTNGTVLFKTNDEPTPPIVPPVPPDDSSDPNGADDPTNNTEPLRIDIAPNFHFGTFSVGTGNHTAQNTRQESNLQVTDGRGTLAGWTVSVAKTELKNKDDVLPATLQLTPGTVKNSNKEAVTLKGNLTAPVTVTTAAQPILAAEQNEGGGTYYQNFDDNKAELSFNSDQAKVGTYTSTITWTLSSATPEGAR
ncbi:WxL domain-containing protein [Listeria sp. PSOL-1]|uniref:WxL domain-containing protein n=1 Tax=Listeria sp. PSOL-1 TaxID=1844999 RepID=UPI0013D63B91|nr:WxL domain-containing protein [Listeria sp. PSOL-1]